MNKEFLTDMYDVVKAEGYPDDFNTFVTTIQSDTAFQNDLFSTVKEGGYPDGINDFKALIGVPSKPARTPEQIKSEGENAYDIMNKQIAKEQELADVEERYGAVRDNPLLSVPLSVLAPSTVESIQEGKLPSWTDAAIDVPLAASALLTAPFRATTALGRVGRGALVGAGLGAATEGALTAAHDREFNPRSMATSVALGTIGGGIGGGISAQGRSNLAKLLPDERALNYAESVLEAPRIPFGGTTQEKMAQGIKKIVPDVRKDAAGLVDKPEEFLSAVEKTANDRIRSRAIVSDISGREIANKQKALGEFNEDILRLTTTASDLLPVPAALDEVMALYRKDPYLGTVALEKLEPYLRKARTNREVIKAIGDPKKIAGDYALIPEMKRSTKDLLNKMGYSSQYDEAMKAVEKPKPQFQGSYGKAAYDALKSGKMSPETAVTLSRVGQSAGARVAPRPTQKSQRDEYGRATDEQGNMLYAPKGNVTWDWLWGEADKMKKGKK